MRMQSINSTCTEFHSTILESTLFFKLTPGPTCCGLLSSVCPAVLVGGNEREEIQRLCPGDPEGLAQTHRRPQVRQDERGR